MRSQVFSGISEARRKFQALLISTWGVQAGSNISNTFIKKSFIKVVTHTVFTVLTSASTPHHPSSSVHHSTLCFPLLLIFLTFNLLCKSLHPGSMSSTLLKLLPQRLPTRVLDWPVYSTISILILLTLHVVFDSCLFLLSFSCLKASMAPPIQVSNPSDYYKAST